MEKLLTFLIELFNELTGDSIRWRGYFKYCGIAFAICGLAWLVIRKRVPNLSARRKWSSLIFALTLTPAVVPLHSTLIVMPAFFLVFVGSYESPSFAIFGCGLILFVWVLLFAVRSLFAKFCNRRKQDAQV
ncbi:MAG: hypothetical protein NTZ16_09495 [Verrucomicrobia bacterium]|nr:hypothetical protein [Verrucomicrobiota bacterium]